MPPLVGGVIHMRIEGRENGKIGKMRHKSLNGPGATSILGLGRLGKITGR